MTHIFLIEEGTVQRTVVTRQGCRARPSGRATLTVVDVRRDATSVHEACERMEVREEYERVRQLRQRPIVNTSLGQRLRSETEVKTVQNTTHSLNSANAVGIIKIKCKNN